MFEFLKLKMKNNEELDSELSDKLASVSKEAEQIKNHCKGK